MSQKSNEQNSTMIWLHWIGVIYVSMIAGALVVVTAAAMINFLPWLDLVVSTSRGPSQIGPNVQMIATGLALVLLVYLPSSLRVLKLEASHREFAMTMDDVSKAYLASHEGDREGLFNLSSEFDSVRERINHMRDHPELAKLEPAVLDVAAQMSHVTRDLAAVYSDEAVTRAKSILRQRQVELEEFTDHLSMARRQTDEIKRWTQQMQVEGNVADAQLSQLRQDLSEILPTLGLKVIRGPKVQPKPELEAKVVNPPKQIEQGNIVAIADDANPKPAKDSNRRGSEAAQ
ncbi:MAG: DNA repair protein [Planktomarina sp.]